MRNKPPRPPALFFTATGLHSCVRRANDLLMRVTVENRGPQAAPLRVLPQIWFRNTWSWKGGARKPVLRTTGSRKIRAEHPGLGTYHVYVDGAPAEMLFCDNESNGTRLWNTDRSSGYWKDAFHERVVNGNVAAVNRGQEGTKAAAWYVVEVPAGGRVRIQLRLSKQVLPDPFTDAEALFERRIREADEFYAALQEGVERADARTVQRQAFAGMIWSKQY
jgi:hypothetical protein